MDCEEFAETIRQSSDQVLATLQLAANVAAPPALCREKNGCGKEYFTLRYYSPRSPTRQGKQRRIYIGELTTEESEILQKVISVLWVNADKYLRSTEYIVHTEKHRHERKQAMCDAQAAATRVGYRLHGLVIRRLRKADRLHITPSQERDGLAKVADHLRRARTANLATLTGILGCLHIMISRPSNLEELAPEKQLSRGMKGLFQSAIYARRIWCRIDGALESIERHCTRLEMAS